MLNFCLESGMQLMKRDSYKKWKISCKTYFSLGSCSKLFKKALPADVISL